MAICACGCLWIPMDRIAIGTYGGPWMLMDGYWCLWMLMDSNGCLWRPVKAYG